MLPEKHVRSDSKVRKLSSSGLLHKTSAVIRFLPLNQIFSRESASGTSKQMSFSSGGPNLKTFVSAVFELEILEDGTTLHPPYAALAQ